MVAAQRPGELAGDLSHRFGGDLGPRPTRPGWCASVTEIKSSGHPDNLCGRSSTTDIQPIALAEDRAQLALRDLLDAARRINEELELSLTHAERSTPTANHPQGVRHLVRC